MKLQNPTLLARRLRGGLLVLVFISVFLYIFSLNFRAPERMDLLQRSVVEVLSPPIQFLGGIFGAIEDFIKGYVWLRNVRHENEALKQEVSELEKKITSYQEAYVENLRLRRLLDFKSSIKIETLAAQVTMHDLTGWFQTLLVDKGFRDGVGPDMPVVNDEGVIGRVLDVSDRHSRVLLITDPGSSVDAIIQRNRVRGILTGKDANGCVLRYVRGNVDVQVGDLIITSGKDGVFPKGLRLGLIQGIFKDPVDLFQKIEVRPLVRLAALEEVMLIKREGVMADLEGGTEQPQEPAQAPPQTPPQAAPNAQKTQERETPGQQQAKPQEQAKPKPQKPPEKPKPQQSLREPLRRPDASKPPPPQTKPVRRSSPQQNKKPQEKLKPQQKPQNQPKAQQQKPPEQKKPQQQDKPERQ
jgi:rod shape-determining protein MreC